MYYTLLPYKCLKCGMETEYSPDNRHPAPVTPGFVTCPLCWEEWLRANIGELACTVSFKYGVLSEYDRKNQ